MTCPRGFRELARDAVDWMADYLAGVEHYPVLARVRPGDLKASPSRAPRPKRPRTWPGVLQDFEDLVLPGITHWNHPSFHGYFAVTGSGPGILGEMLAATLNVNAMVWRSSPAGTELEEHVLGWIREFLGLPKAYFGVIQDTASSSSLVALAAARQRAYPEVRRRGSSGSPGRIYASVEAHSSIDKAGVTLGFGLEGVRKIPVDERLPDGSRRPARRHRGGPGRGDPPRGRGGHGGDHLHLEPGPGSGHRPGGPGPRPLAARGRGLRRRRRVGAGTPAALRGWEEADSIVFNPTSGSSPRWTARCSTRGTRVS
jgi:hypothetical protein